MSTREEAHAEGAKVFRLVVERADERYPRAVAAEDCWPWLREHEPKLVAEMDRHDEEANECIRAEDLDGFKRAYIAWGKTVLRLYEAYEKGAA